MIIEIQRRNMRDWMSDLKDLCNEKCDREGDVRPVIGSKLRH